MLINLNLPALFNSFPFQTANFLTKEKATKNCTRPVDDISWFAPPAQLSLEQSPTDEGMKPSEFGVDNQSVDRQTTTKLHL